jgi:multidrug resistance efflux pump
LGGGIFQRNPIAAHQTSQKAIITMMGYENQPFEGVVRSLGWGVFVQDGSGGTGTGLLPAINPTIDWVRLPQRFAVRIQVTGETPVPLRIGQTVSVAMTQSFAPLGSNEIADSKY